MDNRFCVKCGAPITPNSAFCGKCGAKLDEYVEPTPAQQYRAYQTYTVDPYAPKPLSVKSKVFGGIGLGLSIFGFVWAIICFFFAMASTDSYGEPFAIIGFFYSFILIVCSILGLVFANMARNDGNYSGLTSTGKGLGVAGLVIFILNIVISMANLG